MQDIFILRHAQAEDLTNGDLKNDFDRNLTEDGIKKTTKLSSLFNELEENVDLVLTSPYIRAKETAKLFISNLNPKPELKIVDFLGSGASCKEIAKGLLPYISLTKIVIVGHAPDLEIFLGRLIGAERIKLKKGALGKVILSNSIELSGELEWLITPRLIKKFKIKKIETSPVT
mgnify:CR=1 FL=1